MKKIKKFIKMAFVPAFLLLQLSCRGYTGIDPQVQKAFNTLEKSIKTSSVEPVRPYISKNFTINTLDHMVSMKIFSGLVTGFPLKKIKGIEVEKNNGDTLFVTSKFVIDKYLGIFSEEIKFKLLKAGEDYHFLNMTMQMSVEVSVDQHPGNSNKAKKMDMSRFEKLSTGTTLTYFEKNLSDIAPEIHQKQTEGIKIANNALGEELSLPIGLLLLEDSLENMQTDELIIPVAIPNSAIKEDTTAGIFVNWAYFHELTELHLTLTKGISDQNTRWFRDGLADYISHQVCSKLDKEIDEIMMEKRKKSYKKIKGHANLLEWTGTGSNQPLQSGFKGGAAQYAAALQFFIDLTRDHGEQIIPELLASFKGQKNISSKTIINNLSKLTGENIRERIISY